MNALLLDYLWLRPYAQRVEVPTTTRRDAVGHVFQPTFLSIR